MATKKNLGNMTEAELKGKTVFLRADLDVVLHDDQKIAGDDTRIRASVPTIKFLTEKGAKVILASHPGRPKGVTPKFSLKPLVPRLSELLEVDVVMANDCISEEDVQRLAATLPDGGVFLLEDARFYEEEEKDNINPEFAKKLASIVDIYISDAYAHKALPQGERLPGVFAFDINDGIDMVMAMKHGLPDKMGHCGGDSFAVGESMLEDKVIHHISTHGGHHASTKMREGKGLPGVFSWTVGNGSDSAVASKSGKEDKTSHHILVDDVVISKMLVGKSHRTLPDDGDFAYEATSSGGDSVLFSESGGVKGGKVIHHIPTEVIRGHASTKVQEGKGLLGAFDWSGNSGSVVTGESGEIEHI